MPTQYNDLENGQKSICRGWAFLIARRFLFVVIIRQGRYLIVIKVEELPDFWNADRLQNFADLRYFLQSLG